MSVQPPSLLAQDIFSVAKKVVVITGGGTGIGQMLAKGFVANGAQVYIVGRRSDVLDRAVEELNALGQVKAFAVVGDVSTKDGAKGLGDAIQAREDHVDVLINNAGVFRPWRGAPQDVAKHNDPETVQNLLWAGVDDVDWTETHKVNVNGVYFMTAALIPLLRKSDSPSVINISSYASIANQRAVSSLTYGVSKAGTNHLSTMLAGRLAPLKIRVNTIMPGAFASEITTTTDDNGNTVFHGPAIKAAMRSPAGKILIVNGIVLHAYQNRRPGNAHEIVGPALLLASAGGGFMNNAIFPVDGGRQMCAGMDDGFRYTDEYY